MSTKKKGFIASIKKRDPAATYWWVILTCYPGIHAVFIYRIAHFLWKIRLQWFARFISHVGRFLTGIEIHQGARIGRRFFIDHGMSVVIGETAEIGDDCTMYHGVTLGGTSWNKGKRHPTIGNGVVLGAYAQILGPITIGDGARVGCFAVVTKSMPPNSVARGPVADIFEKGPNGEVVFSAYALDRETSDPRAKAFQELTQRVENLEGKSRLFNVLEKELTPTSVSAE